MQSEAMHAGNLKPVSWLVLVVGCIAAGITYWKSTNMVASELSSTIELRATEARYLLEGGIGRYVEALRGLQAQFAANPDLSRHKFRQVTQTLNLERRLPGVQAIVFTQQIGPGGASAFEETVRKEFSKGDLGYPPPQIHPRRADTETHIVQYTEPIITNRAGAWYDLSSEPKRRAAIERARDTGEWSTSGRVKLVVDDIVDGVIFFLPVYRGGITPASVEQRRKLFFGTVMLVVRTEEMLLQVFGKRLLGDLDIEVYDVRDDDPAPMVHGASNVIFDTGSYRQSDLLHGDNPDFPLKHRFAIDMAGGWWHMYVTALPAFTSRSQHWLPPIAALTIGLLSLLLFHFLRTVELSRRKLHAHASQVEQALQSNEQQLVRITESIDAVLWRLEIPAGKISYVSVGVEQVSGRPVQAFYQNPVLWLECIHPADRNEVNAMFKRIVHSRRETFHYRVLRPSGEVRWIRCEAHFIAGTELGTDFVDGIDTDITEQRLLEERLWRSNRALRAIHECEEAIASTDDETALLQAICDIVVRVGYRMAWAGVVPNPGDLRVIPVGRAGAHTGYVDAIREYLEAGKLAQFPNIREAILTCQPGAVTDLASGVVSPFLREEAARHGLKSKMTLPLCDNNVAIGVLNVYAAEHDAFDAEAGTLLMDMAQSLTVAIQALRHRRARRVAEATAHLRERAIEASANAIVIASAQAPDYLIEYVNPAFEHMTGYAASEVIGCSPRFLYGEEPDQPGLCEIRAFLGERRAGQAVVRNYRKDGTPYWSEVHLAPVKDETGKVSHFVAAEYDITAAKAYEAELEFQASYDVLTGVANRNLLRDRLMQAIAYADRYGHPVWVIAINLHRFKFVIDTLGLAAGDMLLKKIAERLQSVVRETDTVARVVGDGFMLVLSERNDEKLSPAVVQRIIDAVGQPLTLAGQEFFPSCGAGVATYPADGDDADTLVKSAGIAGYRSKEMGRDHFQFYTPEMNARSLERLRIESDLRNALAREEFVLHYQPQVNLRTGRIVGMEALLRWQHPELGMLPPTRFIPLAEETGLIVPIGDWVLRAACRQNKAWQRAGLGYLRVAVNLSIRQFAQPNLVQSIAATLQETALEPHYLDIELTESLLMADVEHTARILHGLKALGVHLSIDDFGTGYSSLSYLKRFPIDVLKIDRSFVNDITTNPDDAIIARSVISMAHNLRLQVIAEGVETQSQLAYLRHHGCDHMQGYYFSRPVATDAFQQLLTEGRTLLPAPEEAAMQEQTLLLVDDEANVISALHRLLRVDGYRILRATSTSDAFEMLAQHAVQVILCDQRMPEMNGTEFLSKVKDLYPETIRIMLTGYTDLQSVIDAINHGAIYRFFTKPWDDEILRDTIREAFRHYWLLSKRDGPGQLVGPADPVAGVTQAGMRSAA